MSAWRPSRRAFSKAFVLFVLCAAPMPASAMSLLELQIRIDNVVGSSTRCDRFNQAGRQERNDELNAIYHEAQAATREAYRNLMNDRISALKRHNDTAEQLVRRLKAARSDSFVPDSRLGIVGEVGAQYGSSMQGLQESTSDINKASKEIERTNQEIESAVNKAREEIERIHALCMRQY